MDEEQLIQKDIERRKKFSKAVEQSGLAPASTPNTEADTGQPKGGWFKRQFDVAKDILQGDNRVEKAGDILKKNR